nr:PREDICTED: protein RRP5 homolog [Latimeria chalumnae]|eukprot:XP_014346801.1 PREDICTED: protein RRP5 homolog [Latimeria chalumnae]
MGRWPGISQRSRWGALLTSFIKNLMPYGVFVEFPHGLVGLAPKSAMCNKFVTSTGDHFVVGQTVVAKVTNLDKEKRRVLLSLKVLECCSEDAGAKSLALLSQILQEQQAARDQMANRDKGALAFTVVSWLLLVRDSWSNA